MDRSKLAYCQERFLEKRDAAVLLRVAEDTKFLMSGRCVPGCVYLATTWEKTLNNQVDKTGLCLDASLFSQPPRNLPN